VSIYCNCRHCTAAAPKPLPEPPVPVAEIELRALVDKYAALTRNEVEMHFRAVSIARAHAVSDEWEDY